MSRLERSITGALSRFTRDRAGAHRPDDDDTPSGGRRRTAPPLGPEDGPEGAPARPAHPAHPAGRDGPTRVRAGHADAPTAGRPHPAPRERARPRPAAGTASAPVPGSVWLARASGLRPEVAGAALAAALLSGFFAIEVLSGRPARLAAGDSPAAVGCPWLWGDYRIAIVASLALAAVVAGRALLAATTRENLAALWTPLRRGIAAPEPERGSSLGGRLAGLAGIVATVGVAAEIAERPVELTRAYWIWPHVFEWAWLAPFGWLAGRLLHEVVLDARAVSRLAGELPRVDLLDLRWAAPFARQGLQGALVVVTLGGILAGLFVDPGAGPRLAVVVGVLLAAGAVLLALPGAGARRRVRFEKHQALERLRQEIGERGALVLAGRDDPTARGRLPDLVALESRIARVPEWPERGAAARLAGLAAAGLVAWLATSGLVAAIRGGIAS